MYTQIHAHATLVVRIEIERSHIRCMHVLVLSSMSVAHIRICVYGAQVNG